MKGMNTDMRLVGHGFAESIHQRALALELREAGIQLDREARFPVLYKIKRSGSSSPI
jgi:GxxExxY protein